MNARTGNGGAIWCWVLLLGFVVVGMFLYPAIQVSLMDSPELDIMGSIGKQIYTAIEYEELYDNSSPVGGWPVEGDYKNSTDFLRSLITNNIIEGVGFDFFGGAGVKSPKDPMDPNEFTSENNAWCVVLHPTNDLSEAEQKSLKAAPFLFTRNVRFGSPPRLPKTGDTIANVTKVAHASPQA